MLTKLQQLEMGLRPRAVAQQAPAREAHQQLQLHQQAQLAPAPLQRSSALDQLSPPPHPQLPSRAHHQPLGKVPTGQPQLVQKEGLLQEAAQQLQLQRLGPQLLVVVAVVAV
jgi:hypothetical protein